MKLNLFVSTVVGITLALLAPCQVSLQAAKPSAKDALGLNPIQRDGEFDQPTAEEAGISAPVVDIDTSTITIDVVRRSADAGRTP